MVCNATSCRFGFETVVTPQVGEISGSNRAFIEAFSFIIFLAGVTLNTTILTTLISTYPKIDSFDGLLMNLSFGELLSSFGLAFVFFVEFTTSMAPIGDSGCRFLSWLDVTSVTITVTSLVALAYELHKRVYYSNRRPTTRRQFWCCVLVTWMVASVPGLPYMATSKMVGRYCRISRWSTDAEIMYICGMIFFQLVIPIGAVLFFFVRILLALRTSNVEAEGSILNEENSTPGSESTFQRTVLKRKAVFVLVMSITFFLLLAVVSFFQLGLVLDVNHVKENSSGYALMDELNKLLLCLKCVIIPVIYFCCYDLLKSRIKRCCSRKRNNDVYNSLHYNVYQQTVVEGVEITNGGEVPHIDADEEEENPLEAANADLYETERDDVAILDN